ncbi:hypothetical protein UFOVP1049_64 [uncultured Caudovirales phage]|uniref:Uncharacterized protein n=1 Tax=uncultured Caudovirales phage TaxID=2100421 RepID=A0A6J5Q8K0_9CAUD|nr:hypothetical protein UFOVP1049_64 [uncultured Caudovirales phage]
MADNTTTQTNIQGFAPQIAPYAESVLGGAAKAVAEPYQSYADWARKRGLSGDQVQAFTDLQRKSFTGAEGLAQDPYSQAAAQGIQGLAQRAGDLNYAATQFGNQFQAPQNLGYNAQNAQNTYLGAAPTVQQQPTYNAPTMGAAQTGYNPQLQNYQMGPARDVSASNYATPEMRAAQTGYNPQLQTFQMGPAERVNTQSFAQPGSADAYMSPYMQNVVDVQKREAARQSGIQGQQQQAQAVSAGAFGGSRDAIMRAERERNLAQQTGDIQAQGSQAAYQQAQQQFNAEQQARLQAQQANQQAGLTVGQQNLASQIGTQQLGAGQIGLQTSLANLSNAQQQQVQNQAAQLQTQGMSAQQAMQAALANQQKDLTMGQQNLAANLGVQQLGTQTGLQTSLANLSNQQQQQVQNQASQLQTQGMNAQQALQMALANQSTQSQYGLTQGQLSQQTNLANQAAQNQASQFGAGQGLQAAGLGAQYGLAAQQEAERSKQFGANLGLQGMQAGMQGYGALGSQGQNLYGQTTNNLQLQNAFGTQQQQQGQNMIDVNQQNYAAEQNYPYKQVGFMSDIINRQPVSNLGSTITSPPPSLISQGLGAAAAFYGAKKAAGGAIRSYRGAGLVDLALSGM